MTNGLKEAGEKYILENNIDNLTVEVSLYNDSKDNIGRSPTESDITTEPINIIREEITLTLEKVNTRWRFISNSTVTLDVSNSTGKVDSYFLKVDSTNNGTYDIFFLSGELEEPGNVEYYDTYKLEPGAGGIFSTPR